MRKQLKKSMAVLLSVLICGSILTSLPATAFAVETDSAVGATSGKTGDCTWVFNQSTGVLTISGNGKMDVYEDYETIPWINLPIQEAIIEDGVANICDYAFFENETLTKVTIPGSVKSLGTATFANCSKLKNVVIPDGVSKIGFYTFNECTELQTVSIGNTVQEIPTRTFRQCSGLKSIIIGDNVSHIDERAFEQCTSLSSITVSNKNKTFDSRNDCNAIILSKTDTLILGCKKSVIPNNVKIIGGDSFNYCEELTSISIPNNVKKIEDGAFFCSGLQDICIPDSITTIGWGTFMGCTNLTNVVIPKSVKTIDDSAFFRCTSLKKVTIPESVTSIGEYAFGYYENDSDDYEYEDDYDYNDEEYSNEEYYDDDYFEFPKIENFTIYGKKGSEAETYAKENGFKFIEISDSIEKNDADTGISVTLPEDLTLRVDDAADSDSVKNIVLTDNETLLKAFDITLLKDGKKTQPDGSVTVKIPCDNSKAKVYRVESNNSLTDMNADYQAGYLVFSTDHFSVYVVTEPKTVLIGDVNNDGKVNGADAGLLNRYTSGWDGYAEKIKNMDAADINRDGKVNGADSGLLNRYTSGWENVKKYFAA